MVRARGLRYRPTMPDIGRFIMILVMVLLILPTNSIHAKAGSHRASATTAAVAGSAYGGIHFIHTTSSSNITANYTVLDHPALNGNPSAILIITPNWNPSGTTPGYHNHVIGVWYNPIQNRWTIFNESLAAMPPGSKFNVFVPDTTVIPTFIHTATGSNSSGNRTRLDHPALNNNPDAIVLVTQSYNPFSIYNNQNTGVWYNTTNNRWEIFNQNVAANVPDNASFNVALVSDQATAFVHKSLVTNIVGNSTYPESALLKGDPDVMMYITSNYNPGVIGGTYNNHATGVWYDATPRAWSIFNQDLANIPVNAAFNVFVAPKTQATFLHRATSDNISANWTRVNHETLNGDPHGVAFITSNWNPGSASGVYNDEPTGVFFDSLSQRLAIFNQSMDAMPVGAAFNVFVPAPSLRRFVHTATAANTDGNNTQIDHPLLNGNPAAIVIVTPNWNPGETTGTYNNRPIGVFYVVGDAKWAIFNQDLAAMPVGADFNVFVATGLPNAFIHTVPATTGSNYTYLDHPRLNNNPYASIFVTHNWGTLGPYNNRNIGVWYNVSTGRWAIYNQNTASTIAANAKFNVFFISHRVYLPLSLR